MKEGFPLPCRGEEIFSAIFKLTTEIQALDQWDVLVSGVFLEDKGSRRFYKVEVFDQLFRQFF